MSTITEFSGAYRFLSNFYPSPIHVSGMGVTPITIWPTAEHLYQALKSTSTYTHHSILQLSTPGQAKGFGRQVMLRDNWEENKIPFMHWVVTQKFSQNPDLLIRLGATGDSHLSEGNHHGDTFWGVDLKTEDHPGENYLGRILMSVRSELVPSLS